MLSSHRIVRTCRNHPALEIVRHDADKAAWEAANSGQVYRRGAPQPLAPTARKSSAARNYSTPIMILYGALAKIVGRALMKIRHYQKIRRGVNSKAGLPAGGA